MRERIKKKRGVTVERGTGRERKTEEERTGRRESKRE